MSGKRHIWVLGALHKDEADLQQQLAERNVVMTRFDTIEPLQASARGIHTHLPSLVAMPPHWVTPYFSGPPQTASRIAVLKHGRILIVGDLAPDSRALVGSRRLVQNIPAVNGVQDLAEAMSRCLPNGSAGNEDLCFDTGLMVVGRNGQQAQLTPREFQLLSILYDAKSGTVSRDDLFATVWPQVKVCNKVLDVHVSKLRKKLAPMALGISFIRPGSYKLDVARQQAGGGGMSTPGMDRGPMAAAAAD